MFKETKFVEFYCRFTELTDEEIKEKEEVFGELSDEEKYLWDFVTLDVNSVVASNPCDGDMTTIRFADGGGYIILYPYKKFKSEFMTNAIDRVPKDVRDYLKKQELLND